MQWLPGHELTNRPYKIEKELGQGGFGITYKAIDLTLDIPVVIKTPNSKLQKDNNYQKYVTNFTREAKQLAQLGLNPHPHIVRVSSLFKEDNLPCIVMDYVPGQSLYDLVWSQGKLSEAKAVEYIRQIGSALVVCHQAGIVHRDVHPNNILIHADNGKAILIDFGISGSTQTSRNTHSGNRAFAPWEQVAYWEGENSKTPQVDIYTLAASLYFLVTGQEPTECLARKYNNSELIEPKQLNSELNDEIDQAILKGVEVLPKNRPNSMEEWLSLLNLASPKENRNSDKIFISKSSIENLDIQDGWLEANYQTGKNRGREIPPTVEPFVNITNLAEENEQIDSVSKTKNHEDDWKQEFLNSEKKQVNNAIELSDSNRNFHSDTDNIKEVERNEEIFKGFLLISIVSFIHQYVSMSVFGHVVTDEEIQIILPPLVYWVVFIASFYIRDHKKIIKSSLIKLNFIDKSNVYKLFVLFILVVLLLIFSETLTSYYLIREKIENLQNPRLFYLAHLKKGGYIPVLIFIINTTYSLFSLPRDLVIIFSKINYNREKPYKKNTFILTLITISTLSIFLADTLVRFSVFRKFFW